ncbi:hypothetical protein [Lutibacter sp.]|uniref:hypothetical protein n=1 Tax=Lutibacter sp. TaxID=1925666 RepID=UPI0025B9FEF9|nr:hypothetical protein [Lutibacter sp.]MCF6181639.1 hypothetical protein [Lutibacter sp.]
MSIVLIVVSSFIGQAQDNDETNYEIFNSYGNFGYSFAPVLFNKATITRNYGNTILTNRPILSYQLGVVYHFQPAKEWGINTGLTLTRLPISNISFNLNDNDVYPGYGGSNKSKSIGSLFLSVPINVELKKQLAKNLYANLNFGINISFIPSDGYEEVYIYSNQELQESREVFAMYQLTGSDNLNASIVLSGGFYFTLKHCLIKTNLVYNKSFKNIVEGEYQFGNLLVSEPTRGDYKISGDYFALATTIYFKIKKKHKKKKQH